MIVKIDQSARSGCVRDYADPVYVVAMRSSRYYVNFVRDVKILTNTISWLLSAALACILGIISITTKKNQKKARLTLGILAVFFLACAIAIFFLGTERTSADSTNSTQNYSNNQGIITNNQSGGSDTVNNFGPEDRSLSPSQSLALTNSLHGTQTPLLLMSLGDQEANAYAKQVFAAIINSGVATVPFGFGTMSPPQYGITVFPNGNDATTIESALKTANITFSVDNDMLPVPGSVMDQYKSYVGLLVGLRGD